MLFAGHEDIVFAKPQRRKEQFEMLNQRFGFRQTQRAGIKFLALDVGGRKVIAVPKMDVTGEMFGVQEAQQRREQPRSDPAAADHSDRANIA